MRRTLIALATAAAVGAPTLCSGSAQAQPATTGNISSDGHTLALSATRGALAPASSPMLKIHWVPTADQEPPAPNPGPTTPPSPTPDPGVPTPDPGPTTPPSPTPDPGVPTPDPGPTTPNPGPTTPPSPGTDPSTNPPTPGHTPSKPGGQYNAADRGTPRLPAGSGPSARPPAPTGISDITKLASGAPSPEAAPTPNATNQRPTASELAQTGAGSSTLASASFGATGLALLAMRRKTRSSRS